MGGAEAEQVQRVGARVSEQARRVGAEAEQAARAAGGGQSVGTRRTTKKEDERDASPGGREVLLPPLAVGTQNGYSIWVTCWSSI